ncbi:hypothetical protein RclHR1_00340035 [Rhizophagus clarus]|uniref:Uncharacterized protein n=1 Tax=Rhizophagus clarus TaxID=94130 RepID=A0A2Z6RLI1_9GLOM|nr:hypothetical protein RclHR1_00340035 [Rhizophagus clarus]GES92841.1 hypothetical protein GLOIN_2v1810924 [Rhizophagus clarus]
MFLLESFPPFRTTEPKFFSKLRLLTAFVLSCALGYYIWNSFSKFISELDEKLGISYSYPSFEICAKTLNNKQNVDSSLNISLYRFDPNLDITSYLYNDNKDTRLNTPSLSDKDYNFTNVDDSCIKFSSYYFGDLIFIITYNNTSNYNYFEINFTYNGYTPIFPNQYFIATGRCYVYEFYYKKRKSYSLSLLGFLGFDTDQVDMIIEIENQEFAQLPNNSITVLRLEPSNKYDTITSEVVKYDNNVIKLLENFGGFYSAISGLFILLFGASKLSPWGICQIHLLRCWPLHRKFKKHLARRYVSRAGIPLVEDPRKLPAGSKIEDRVAVLENLLREYYIDDYFLDMLRKSRKKYLNIHNENLELLGDDDDADMIYV